MKILLRIFHTLAFALILVIIFFVFSGCGAIVGYGNILHGPTQEVQIFTKPEGATAEIDGNMRVMTPNLVTLKRKSNHQIRIEKDGYKEFTLPLNKKISGIIIFDVFSLPYPGLISDLFIGGGGYNLSPKVVNVKLYRKEGVIENEEDKEIPMKSAFLPVEEEIKSGKHPEVVVKTKSKRGYIGKLWELQDNSVLIQPLSWKEDPVSIDLNTISQIELRKKVYSRTGFINGTIIGILVNTFITTPILSNVFSNGNSSLIPSILIVGGIIGARIGAEIGGLTGFLMDLSDKTYTPRIDFSKLSEQEKVIKIRQLIY